MPLCDLETWMWAEACTILDREDQLHRQFFRPFVMNVRQPTWVPPVDIYETEFEFIIMTALPGVASEQLTVHQESSYIVINGQRRLPAPLTSHIRRLEIPYGQFERRIELPDGHFEFVSQEFSNGCLFIRLRKL